MTKFGTSSAGDLASRCRRYLEIGPPPKMKDYMPGSLTEVIIAHGAQGEPLDSELRDIGQIVTMEMAEYENDDATVLAYMKKGAKLVEEILSQPISDRKS